MKKVIPLDRVSILEYLTSDSDCNSTSRTRSNRNVRDLQASDVGHIEVKVKKF